ncbi:hypothetical protein [Saccharospirillum mangrovi]|uniref:hypothetical protein n=1 Tax=Saccharospirillum mangrovi TaxID=2161747 RepID=UPI000D3CC506|nr:hypothetical protein [Saccharospirillum mangrovi]
MNTLKWAAPAAFALMVLAGCNPSSSNNDDNDDACSGTITDGTCISGFEFSTDRMTNVLVESPWYAYNFNGAHKIFPNYRVYAVDNTTDDIVTIFQIVDYYNDAGTSGHITLRHRDITGDANTIFENELDASSSTVYVSFTASGGLTVVSESDDFDLSFNRTTVSVGENRETALVAAQSNYYDSEGNPIKSVFIDEDSADKPDNASDVMKETYLVGDLTFAADELDPAINRDGTDKVTGTLIPDTNVANPENVLIMRSAEGDSFAKVSFTNLTYNSTSHVVTVAAKFFVQKSGESNFNNSAITWNRDDSSENCFDFDGGTTVDCGTSVWDIKYSSGGASVDFLLNGGVSGDGSAAVYYGDE